MASIFKNNNFLVVCRNESILVYDLSIKQFVNVDVIKIYDNFKESKGQENKRDNTILSSKFSLSGNLFAISTNNKHLLLFEPRNSWNLLNIRIVTKRTTSIEFNRDETEILIADKSGDVVKYKVNPKEFEHCKEGQFILGHVSMLLDLKLCQNDKYLITCDRDEKIRVSNYSNSYIIESFCLGHTDFVSQLIYIEDDDLLMSGGGDGKIFLWNYVNGEKLEEFINCQIYLPTKEDSLCPNFIPNQTGLENPCTGTDINRLKISKELQILIVSFNRRNELLLFKLYKNENNMKPGLKFIDIFIAEGNVVDICLINDTIMYLYWQEDVILLSIKQIVINETGTYKIMPSSEFEEINLQDKLNSHLEKIKTPDSKSDPKYGVSLHKMHIDNLTEYIERKRTRNIDKIQKNIKKTESKKLKS